MGCHTGVRSTFFFSAITLILSSLSPKRDCGPKRVEVCQPIPNIHGYFVEISGREKTFRKYHVPRLKHPLPLAIRLPMSIALEKRSHPPLCEVPRFVRYSPRDIPWDWDIPRDHSFVGTEAGRIKRQTRGMLENAPNKPEPEEEVEKKKI